MKRRRGFRLFKPRKIDPATKQGISNSLHEAFDQLEQSEDARMQRLIAQMKNFEGTRD